MTAMDVSMRQGWMNGSRRERWRIGVWARDFGHARELGEYRGSYQVLHRRGRWEAGAVVFTLGVLLFAAAGAPGAAGAVAIGSASALVALGVVLAISAPRRKVDWVFWYSGGLVQFVDGESAPRVVHWHQLAHVVRWFSQLTEGDPYPVGVSVTGTDGTEIEVNGGNLGFPRLDRGISELVAGERLPMAIEQCVRGVPVHFGDLTVSRDGIACAGEYAPWRDIGSLRMAPHEIRIAGRREPLSLIGVPDACVAIPLIQEMAARHEVRVQLNGSLATAALPAMKPANLPRDTVLSEAEVSEVLGWPMYADLPFGKHAARFSGGGVTVNLEWRKAAALDGVVVRLSGRAVPGFGHKAWLMPKSETTLVARVGAITLKLDVPDLPPPARAAVLVRLGQLAAARLAV
jgi:hypothetical protein